MLPHLQAALTPAEAAKAQARRLKKQDIGSLAIGICTGIEASSPAALLLETVHKLNSIELSVEVAATEAVERRLLAGEFDAAVLAPVNETNERFDLNLIHQDELVVAFAEGHRFAKQTSVTLDTLDAEPLVIRGSTWTTDAPFRETADVIAMRRNQGILTVEMEAASLLAFGRASERPVVCLAHVTNQLGCVDGDFEKGEHNGAAHSLTMGLSIAGACCGAMQEKRFA